MIQIAGPTIITATKIIEIAAATFRLNLRSSLRWTGSATIERDNAHVSAATKGKIRRTDRTIAASVSKKNAATESRSRVHHPRLALSVSGSLVTQARATRRKQHHAARRTQHPFLEYSLSKQ